MSDFEGAGIHGSEMQRADPLPGMVLNHRYSVGALLATGTRARVYRGEQALLRRPVAIKVRTLDGASEVEATEFRERFLREANVLSRLLHPNLATVLDYGSLPGATEAYFLVTELLVGETLAQRLRARGALPARTAIDVVRGVAHGLREAHRHGIVHGPIDPSSVLLTPTGGRGVKVLGLGLADRVREEPDAVARRLRLLDAPRYMSPEQIARGHVDPRSDVYALGILLYECLTGRFPFDDERPMQVLIAHLQKPVPRAAERAPGVAVDPGLEDLARRCLEKDPAARPESLDDLLCDLRDVERAMGPATDDDAEERGADDPSEREVPATAVVLAAFERTRPGARYALSAVIAAVVATGLTLALRAPADGGPSEPSPREELREPATYALTIECPTPGATVFERRTALGPPPLVVTIDNGAARSHRRSFEVRAPGHRPRELVVEPSRAASVRRTVVLTRLPEAASARALDAAFASHPPPGFLRP